VNDDGPDYHQAELNEREPFPPHQISKLPKPTKAQTEEVKADYKKGIRCDICGAWHHPKVVHLDYVGHAALTDRLLDADPSWSWKPLAMGDDGLPRLDADGGMWIELTVCGVTRLGYGDAQDKTGANAVKERIGDALRNAAMRFGAALDLWHKGDLHTEDEDTKGNGNGVVGQVLGAKVTPTSGAGEGLTPQRKAEIKTLASRCFDFLNSDSPTAVADAVAIADEAELDADEAVYFWSFFDSRQRSAMKAEGKARRLRALQREEASQA
jgi:hypothetical protein